MRIRHPNKLIQIAALTVAILGSSAAWSVTITKTQDLGFGSFVAGTGGSVTISTDGTRTASGDVTLSSRGLHAQASFTISGDPFTNYTITLPADMTVTLTNAQGQTMSLVSFTSFPSGSGQIPSTGSQALNVGATLQVGNHQAPGAYSGTVTITLTY